MSAKSAIWPLVIALLALLGLAGLASAAEGEVTKADVGAANFHLKVGEKEYVCRYAEVKIISSAGKPLSGEKVKLKAGVKVNATIDGDRVTEIRLLVPKKP